MKIILSQMLCIIALLALRGQSYAQTQISGRLTATDGTPLSAASYALLAARDSSLVRTGQTDEKGSFVMTGILPGQYFVRFSSIGYQAFSTPPFDLIAGQPQKELLSLVLTKDSRQLGQVVVRAAKPPFQQRPDGIVVNVENNVLTKGSSALEVLERSPGVIIDHRNNSISLNGKDGVLVMLDGKLMRMPIEQLVTLLNGMSGNDIEKIELLTTPPASYDAEGSAGIINIVLKKGKRPGTNGSMSLTGGYGWGEKGTAGISLSHNTGKLNSYGSYTFSHDRSYSHMEGGGSQDFPPLGGKMNNLFWNITKPVQNSHNASLGFDLEPHPGLSTGASLTYTNSNVSEDSWNRGEYILIPDSTLIFDGNMKSLSHWNNLAAAAYIEKLGRDGSRINFTVDYLRYANNNSSDILSSFSDISAGHPVTTDSLYAPHQRSLGDILIRVGVLKLDNTRSLFKKSKLETGIKANFADSRSSSAVQGLINNSWTTSLGSSSNMRMREGIGAAYASLTTQLAPRTSLTAGLRYEYSGTRTRDLDSGKNTVDRRLGVFFPNLSLTHKLTEKSEILLSYSKRISRPSYNDLASFVGYSDPVAILTGNPLLRPTITNSLKLGYNYRSYAFSILLSHDDYPISRYQLTENADRNILFIGPQNLRYENEINFQTTLPFKPTAWWTMNYSFVGGWRRFKETFTRFPLEKSFFGFSANFSESFSLPKNFTLEISGWYNGGGYNGTSYISGFGVLNGGIKKEMKNNKGTLQLAASDLLSTLHIRGDHGYATQEAFSNVNHFDYSTESRSFPIIRLTYTRSFGSSLGKSRQSNGASDERDRIRKD